MALLVPGHHHEGLAEPAFVFVFRNIYIAPQINPTASIKAPDLPYIPVANIPVGQAVGSSWFGSPPIFQLAALDSFLRSKE
jgi:hypothetical protein